MTINFDLRTALVLEAYTGSKAYGTATPTSDTDIRGIVAPPTDVVLGCNHTFEQAIEEVRKGHPADRTLFDLRKFFRLAADGNPNMLELPFVVDSDVIRASPAGDLLRSRATVFLSKRVLARFSGYAMGQLHRIRSHRNWLLSPPKARPERSEFGLDDKKVLRGDQLGAIEKLVEEGHTLSPNVFELVDAEKRYATALKTWKQYEDWKASRNPARSELEAKHGYDTKHAMHLVRLLRMCLEILETGKVRVRRPDAEELLGIRRGDWTYEALVEWAEAQKQRCEEACERSSLPDAPDAKALDRLCIDVHQLHWSVEW